MGVAVVIEAKHMCMMMRGVQKQASVTTTSAFTGAFKSERTRNEFLKLIYQSAQLGAYAESDGPPYAPHCGR